MGKCFSLIDYFMAYSTRLIEEVMRCCNEGESVARVAMRFRVSKDAIKRWQDLMKRTGGTWEPSLVRSRKLDPQKVKEFFDANPGVSKIKAAQEFGVSGSTIRRVLREIKYKRKKRKFDPQKAKEFFDANPYALQKEAAQELGVSDSSIRRALRKIMYERKKRPVQKKETRRTYRPRDPSLVSALRQLDPQKVKEFFDANPYALQRDAAQELGVNVSSIQRVLRKIKCRREKESAQEGEIRRISSPWEPSSIRFRKLNPQKVKEFFDANPDASQREAAQAFGVSDSSIQRVLRKIKYRRKKNSHKRKS
jgi:transposase